MSATEKLEAWREGFIEGEKSVLELIKLTTKQDFPSLVMLIQWIREQESK
jgi:hypothetical protein